MDKNHKNINSPLDLISLNYHSANKRAWYLIKFQIKTVPQWAAKVSNTKLCFFREIAYVNSNNELIGLGRSFLPINFFGLSTFLKCVSLFNPKPLGVVLKRKYKNDIVIKVESNISQKINITPYRNELISVESYKRIISIKGYPHIIIVEEDFII